MKFENPVTLKQLIDVERCGLILTTGSIELLTQLKENCIDMDSMLLIQSALSVVKAKSEFDKLLEIMSKKL